MLRFITVMKMSIGILCRIWPLLLLLSTIPSKAQSLGSTLLVVLEDSIDQQIIFSDSLDVYMDKKGLFDIKDMMSMPDSVFKQSTEIRLQHAPYYIWARIRVKNNGQTTRHLYFSHCLETYGYWTYTVEGGAIINQQYTGKNVKPYDRVFSSKNHYTPVSLDAGVERTYFFRLHFLDDVGQEHWTHLSLRPQHVSHHYSMSKFAWQSFYAGVMLLFSVLSLFLFGIFRQKSFVFFALQTMVFVFYFLEQSGFIEAFFTNWFQVQNINLSEWLVTLLIVSIFLFLSNYLQLKDRLPKVYFVYLVFTLICASFLFVAVQFGVSFYIRVQLYNTLLVFWVLLGAIAMVVLAIKKYKEGRVLLISLGVMTLGALFSLISDNISDEYSLMGLMVFQVGSILSSGILFYSLFDKIKDIRREKLRIKELDKLKSKFFANISHEFRTPLTLIMGPLQQLKEHTKDPRDRELLDMAQRNTKRQLALVNQLLELSTLEAGKVVLDAKTQDLIHFLKGVVHAYDSLAEQKGITLKMDCPIDELFVSFNLEKMESVFYNLLSNAFKFTSSGGEVSVSIKQVNESVSVTIADTGVGINAEELPKVFNRFFQTEVSRNEGIEGSGIGLALTKELVELHNGTIHVESEVGRGTKFFLTFPIINNFLSEESTISSKTNAPVILVIEDNHDVRAFIRLRLNEKYRVKEAVNGKEGISQAKKIMPDLIISDVMMPEKDGYEVCRALKTDMHTCHIPIILLTAKASLTEKLSGLETGADDYLTKPFDSRELLTRVDNLIKLRQQLRQRFADSISVKPSEIVTNSRDQAFLEKIVNIIEDKMDKESFGVEELASEVDMSKPNLNRKLRALVDQSTNQFIQSIRLQRAANLLAQKSDTIAEIAIQTGFSSTAYFVKCFKDKYGETPGNYSKKGEQ